MVRVVDQQHDACHGRGSGPCGPELVVREPVALCAWHVNHLARTDAFREAFLSESTLVAERQAVIKDRVEETTHRGRTEAKETEARQARIEARRRQILRDQTVVYYVTRGDLIKIGFTANMTHRMGAILPDSILATEPGGESLERQRHRQFKHLRASLGREYFTRGDDLLTHIAEVIKQHGPARMTSWPKVEKRYYQ
jgi:hypothetical protein